MTDYKKIAEQLRRDTVGDDRRIVALYLAAADLCERMARGELVERAPTPRYCDFEDCSIDPLEGHQFCEHHQREADCPGPTPPQDPSDAEREHCIRAVEESYPLDGDESVQLLLRERAAADKAGYERGRADQAHATEQYIKDELAAADRAGYERGRSDGRTDIGKYSNAIGRIESLVGLASAVPLSETVAEVAKQLADRDRRISELKSELARWRDAERKARETGISLYIDGESEALALTTAAHEREAHALNRRPLETQLKHTRKRLTALVAAAKNARLHLSGATGGDALRVLRALDAAIAEAEREGGAV